MYNPLLVFALCELQNSGNNNISLCIFDKIVNILSLRLYLFTIFLIYQSDLMINIFLSKASDYAREIILYFHKKNLFI